MSSPVVFDTFSLIRQRARAAAYFADFDFLFKAASERLFERLEVVKSDFSSVLLLGAATGLPEGILDSYCTLSDDCGSFLQSSGISRRILINEALPFAENAFDLALSVGALHRVNDLPGILSQLKCSLKPGGLLLAVFPGGETLRELRESLMQGEMAATGGASPRVHPFIDVRDAGALLQRAGFALPVADSERITVTYPHLFKLMEDLRGMGETNALLERSRTMLRRDTLAQAAEYYTKHFADSEGRLVATFDLITITGWKLDASQAKPLPRGSGKTSLHDVL